MGHDGHDGHDGHEHHHHHHDEKPHEHHRASAPASVSAFVITCSDTRDGASDGGGPLIVKLLEQAGHSVVGNDVVKDDAVAIRDAIEHGYAHGARVIILTGGTGFAPRDVTVETVTPLLDKQMPGFGELFRMLSFQEIGPAAMLSRAVAGTSQRMAIFALPGSPKAIELAMKRLILPELGHLVRELLR